MINECKIPRSCDIFCNVIDNYGDIGVCWRLARQLVHEHGLAVRLWVDDLNSLAKLCHETDAARDIQHCRGVEVRRWAADVFSPLPQPLSRSASHPDETTNHSTKPASGQVAGYLPLAGEELGERGVADLVIEAFACKLPQNYIETMAGRQQSVWINLEYLSAEDWVAGCHGLPSPHPNLPLTKYFFFPGFTKQTGGLLLERDLFARRDAFQSDAAQQQTFWQSIGMEMPSAETLKISLFGYENAALHDLFDAWASGAQPVLCVVPEGRILPQAGQYFGDTAPHAGSSYTRGNLQVHVLPFVEQERYDELLWACDVNFVRGEDSCVRAQWAAKPFVWQIYQQHDAVHWQKLQAFLNLYCAPLSTAASQAMKGMWREWNSGGEAGQAASTKPLVLSVVEGSGQAASTSSEQAWPDFAAARGELNEHAQHWARQLAVNNLALNLLDFSQKIGRMRALKIEGQ